MRQQGPRSPHTELEVGCIFPIAVAAAALVAVGVLVGTRLTAPPAPPPRQVAVRVIDDGAPGGPAVVATAVVPLR
jgi:hypothetical protein